MFYKLQNIVDYEDNLSHIFYSNACETGAGNLFLFSYYLRLFLYLNVDHSIFFFCGSQCGAVYKHWISIIKIRKLEGSNSWYPFAHWMVNDHSSVVFYVFWEHPVKKSVQSRQTEGKFPFNPLQVPSSRVSFVCIFCLTEWDLNSLPFK